MNREAKRDFGVIINERWRFHSHDQHIVSQANSILGLLKMPCVAKGQQYYGNFLDSILILAMVKLVLHACKIENVERQTMKYLKRLKSASYEDHLKLPTLIYRRMHSDMMQAYKLQKENFTIFKGSHSTSHHLTRVHSKNLPKLCFISRICQMYFSQRVINKLE